MVSACIRGNIMCFYNSINGVNQSTFFILPMLGKHPDEYPRFRDCFLFDEDRPEYKGHIHIYTRTGGGNREAYEEQNQMMVDMDGYVDDYDDDFDSTYATWVFEVPEKWKADHDALITGNISAVSNEYKEQMKDVFPKLADKFDEMFNGGNNP